jgi:hypothetical protein
VLRPQFDSEPVGFSPQYRRIGTSGGISISFIYYALFFPHRYSGVFIGGCSSD